MFALATIVLAVATAPPPCHHVAQTMALPVPTPTPCATPTAVPSEIARVRSRGRIDNLIGVASSAAEGFVGHNELEDRPVLRPGELIEAVPGVVISQHSGEGKANQYYLRGFNLDHGTDIAITIGGVPANMRTHAHGQGYSDINWIIPELVNYINYRKGTYYADQGDFATAGAVNMTFFDQLPKSIESVSGGPYEQARILLASSPPVRSNAHLLYAFEYAHTDNTSEDPDNYRKYNGFLRYSRQSAQSSWGITAQAYEARWNSSDQIPQRAVDAGLIGRFGQIDPTDGGRTHRYVLSGDYGAESARSRLAINAYVLSYRLRLFSDFTYFLNDPVNMDQFEQADDRIVTGINAAHTWKLPKGALTLGYQFRNDNIAPVSLYTSQAQRIIATTRIDHVVETSHALYVQDELRLSPHLRATAGLRADSYIFRVADLRPENSGTMRARILSPKITFSYSPTSTTEYYFDAGESFHSNDARGVLERVDPGTGLITDPGSGQVIAGATPLVRAVGSEFGARFATARRLRTTFSLWNLRLGSELVFQGDAGTTAPSRPSYRYGLELANFWQVTPTETIDLDYSHSEARFTNVEPVGQLIPGSIKDVLTLGVTAERTRTFGSLRLRYFGPRPLIEDGSVFSHPTTTLSLQAGIKLQPGLRVSFDAFNLLNAKASDIDYFYNSSLPSDPTYTKPGYSGPCPIAACGQGVADVHFHPIERPLFRFTITRQL